MQKTNVFDNELSKFCHYYLRQPIGDGAFTQSVFRMRVDEHHIFTKTVGMIRAWEELIRPSRIREFIKTKVMTPPAVNNVNSVTLIKKKIKYSS